MTSLDDITGNDGPCTGNSPKLTSSQFWVVEIYFSKDVQRNRAFTQQQYMGMSWILGKPEGKEHFLGAIYSLLPRLSWLSGCVIRRTWECYWHLEPVKNLKILARNGLIRYSLLHRTNGMIVNLTDWRILGMVRNRTHAIGLSYMTKPMI